MKKAIIVKTRVDLFMEGKVSPSEYRELYQAYESKDHSDRLWITTEEPISRMSTEDIREFLDKRIRDEEESEARHALRVAKARCRHLGIEIGE